jgi:phosphoglycerate dehydrogenase-like enzyme
VTAILVTPRSLTAERGRGDLERLADAGFELVFASAGRQPSEAELLELVPGCVGYLAGVEPITRPVLERAHALRVISRNGSGVDGIDLDAARERGIAVERAVGANARGVAELALTLALAELRHVRVVSASLSVGSWQRRIGRELASLTLGVVGAGAVGSELARMAVGVGTGAVVAHDERPPAELSLPDGVEVLSFDDLIARSDIVSLHCPLPADGNALIGSAELAAMRAGAVLVNTARAELVDDDSVLAALDEGRLAGYATDVFRREPPEPGPLLGHERVLPTPHVGGYTEESVARATAMAVDNLLEHLGPA